MQTVTASESTSPDQSGKIEPARWVEEYGDLLFRFALARVRQREAAEDLVQEALLRPAAWSNWPRATIWQGLQNNSS